MLFQEIMGGVFLIEYEPIEDERGFFARAWCKQEFQRRGLNPEYVQGNISFNKKKGTLRGMHYQAPPHGETKLVRCTRGAIYDVVLDLRPGSPTFRQWAGVKLAEGERKMLYIPEGFAHGYVTLADNTEVFYQVSAAYHPEAERGVRWNDPAFGIKLPVAVTEISRKDKSYGDFTL